MPSAYRASIRHALGPSQVETFEDGLLLLDDQGKIVACGSYEELVLRLPKNCTIHDYRGFWIIPGFVDCHTHLPQLDCRNKNGYTLLDWLKIYIYPAEAKFADPKIAESVALRFFDELLSHGITTAAIYSTIHFEATDIAFKIAKEKGLRVIIGQVLMDQNAPALLLKPAVQSLRESEKLITKWHGVDGRLFYALTPRFALTCSKNLIRDAGKMSQEASCYFQTHLAETKEEVLQAKDLYQFKNYTGFYESNHCLSSHSLFAHCIYLNEAEWRMLGEHKGCVAHCPTSNVFLKSGTMPIAALEKEGIRYGMGTDVGAGPTFSMMEVADCAHAVHPKGVVTNEKAFYLSTLGGAEALALSDQIGNFVEGKCADFAVFEKSDYKGIANEVFVQGELVWKKGKSV
ncbi:MAG: guanine deaminase [Deltaproteobacteria bacterium RIFCSPLOWO2_02_FULL_46_8]|nr:MAG: guanine deaminase [Deltaproteobacteria bacterium RIFCSPLOWO2_02_FULL_46_8]